MTDNKFNSTEDKASYGIGLQMGQQLRETFAGVSVTAAVEGIQDAFDSKPSQIPNEEIGAAFQVIQAQIQKEEAAAAGEQSGEGEAFLAENAKRDGVTITDSGLQYEVMMSGTGEKPLASSTVRTHYRGTLINGEEFDSSYKRNEPTEFPVNGVIPGWTEALQLMTVGSKWKLFIPYQLAYGAQGAGGAIGPYQALVFEIELLDIL